MKFEDVPPEVMQHYHRLSGLLNTPELKEFQCVEHFLIEVQNRVGQARALITSASRNLGGKGPI